MRKIADNYTDAFQEKWLKCTLWLATLHETILSQEQ